MNAPTTAGTIDWTTRTGGRLTPVERRRLVADLARVHAGNAVGRFTLLVGMNRGRNAYVAQERLAAPDSRLTRAARDTAAAVLPGSMLNHSHRTYLFGRALSELEQLDIDAELLFAAAMLHDVGLASASGREDFTLTSARMARAVSERVGLSTAATATLETAITMHHSPRVTVAAGPVAYLLAAGVAVDVVGLRCWDLPRSTLLAAVEAHPRDGFKEYFTRAWAHEAHRVPQGRAALLRRYGAFTAAIALAPFDE